jgi:hypothetical protein
VEKQDPKHFAYVPTKTPVAGEDGDCKVLRHTLELEEQGGYGDGDSSLEDGSVDDVNDMVGPATVVELQARDVVQSMLDTHESQIQSVALLEKVIPYVEYDGNQIYKSTLEHSQPSPCIRALQRGDTGSEGALDATGASSELGEPTLSRHSSLGRPSELPRWQSMPPHQRLLMHRDC